MSAIPLRLRVVLGEDNALERDAYTRLCEAIGCTVVAAKGSYEDVLTAVDRVRPDVVVTDLELPTVGRGAGFKIARHVLDTYRETGVVLISHFNEAALGDVVIRFGARRFAYLLKQSANEQLLRKAIRDAAAGRVNIDLAVMQTITDVAVDGGLLDPLTKREREVLKHVAAGWRNEAIASALHLGMKTVEKHILHIYEKLGLPAGGDYNQRVLAAQIFMRDLGSRG